MSAVETGSRAAAFAHLLAAVSEPVLVLDAAGEPVRGNAAARALVPAPDRAGDARARANLEALRAFVRRPDQGALPLYDLDGEGPPVAFAASLGPASDDDERALVLRDPRPRLPAGLSHELRGPLTAILGYASLLLKGLGGGLSPKQRDKLERVHANGQRLLGLIEERRA